MIKKSGKPSVKTKKTGKEKGNKIDKTEKIESFKDKIRINIIEFLYKENGRTYNYKQIAKTIGINGDDKVRMTLSILKDLADEKLAIEVNPGKFKLNSKADHKEVLAPAYATGVLQIVSTGKGYVICEGLEDDVKISQSNLGHALNGDTVKVYLYAKRKERRLEGEIVEIVKRAKEQFVGTLDINGKFAFLIPNDSELGTDIFIPLSALNGAKHGEKAIVKITEWPERAKNPYGEVVRVLGKPGDHKVEMDTIIFEFELPTEFPANVEDEANKIPLEISKSEIKKRRDFRDILTFTIDPFDAKDFDDALSFQKLENGNYEIGVHIADVTHYIKPASTLDNEAQERGTSVYLVDRVIPMLPEHLSNGVCSLRPNEEKLCFSAVFEMDENASIKNRWFGRTVINSNRRFTYEEVQEIIEKKEGEFCDEILTLDRFAKALRDERKKSGAFNFNKIEVKFDLDETGKPVGVFFKVQKDAHKLIEDFMLLANREVATLIGKLDKGQKYYPLVYRIHDSPNEAKLSEFSTFVNTLGYKIKTTSRKDIVNSMNKLLSDVEGRGEQNMIETLAIRSMAKAQYTVKNIGHYGLAFDYYVHFTSPIRRFPDMMVHRVLENYLAKEKPYASEEDQETMAKHSSKMEMRAASAERASVKYKQVEFLADKIGQLFDGYISGVTKFGLFVEIIENKCEGMIKLKDINDDFYVFDEENYQIIGTRKGHKYKLGDKVQIRVRRADLVKKQLDFELIENEW